LQKLLSFLENHKKLCLYLFVAGFIISGTFTFMLLTSNATDPIHKILFAGMTIVFEFSKAIMLVRFLKTKKSLYGSLWLFTTIVSVIASQGFTINTTNILDNKIRQEQRVIMQNREASIKEQLQNKQNALKNSQDIKKSSITYTAQDKANITAKRNEYDQRIKELQQQINEKAPDMKYAVGKGYTGQVERIQNEINQLRDSIKSTTKARDSLTAVDKSGSEDSNITKLNTDIDSLNKQLGSIDYSSLQDKNTEGTLAILQVMSDMFTGDSKMSGLSKTIFWFWLIISIGFEVLICVLYNEATTGTEKLTDKTKKIFDKGELGALQKELKHIDNTYPATAKLDNTESVKPKQKIEAEKKEQKQEPKQEQELYTDKDIEDWKAYVFKNSNGDIAPGMSAVAKGLNATRKESDYISTKTARAIAGELNRRKITKSEGNKTIILKK